MLGLKRPILNKIKHRFSSALSPAHQRVVRKIFRQHTAIIIDQVYKDVNMSAISTWILTDRNWPKVYDTYTDVSRDPSKISELIQRSGIVSSADLIHTLNIIEPFVYVITLRLMMKSICLSDWRDLLNSTARTTARNSFLNELRGLGINTNSLCNTKEEIKLQRCFEDSTLDYGTTISNVIRIGNYQSWQVDLGYNVASFLIEMK